MNRKSRMCGGFSVAAITATVMIAGGRSVPAQTPRAARPPITSLAFTPDGRSLVIGSQAGVRLVAWPALTHVRDVSHRVGEVCDLAFSPDGRCLAIAGGAPAERGTCEVIRWPDGKRLLLAAAHDDVVYAVAWRPDSGMFATASQDATVALGVLPTDLVADAARANAAATAQANEPDSRSDLADSRLRGHSRGVLAACFLADPSLLLTAGSDQSIRVWGVHSADQGLLRTLENHTAAVYDLVPRPAREGSLPVVASVGQDRTVRFWQPSIGRLMRFTRIADATPLAAAWLADGSRLVVGCSDGRVLWIDPDTSEIVREAAVHSGWCYCVAAHPGTGQVVAGGPDGIRIATPKPPRT